LNPHGPALFLYAVEIGRHPNIADLDEWRPLEISLAPNGHWSHPVSLVLVLLPLAWGVRALSMSHVILIAIFWTWPWFQQRMFNWWLLLSPWLAMPLWAALGRKRNWKWTLDPSTPSFRKTLLAGFVVIILLLWFAPVRWLLTLKPRSLEQSVSRGTPWKLAAQLQASPDAPDPELPKLAQELARRFPEGRFAGSIFASETLGDYLVWALPAEKMPVLMYAHPHLFPPAHWRAFLNTKFGRTGWRQFLDDNQVNLVVVEAELSKDLVTALRADQGWTVILDETGDRAKRNPRDRHFIALRVAPAPKPGAR
jgi:hypothetical protein